MKRFPLNKEKVYITSDSESFKLRDFSRETEIPIVVHSLPSEHMTLIPG